MSESVTDKALRLVEGHRVRILTAGRAWALAEVTGDTRDHRVTLSTGFAGCTCQSTTKCAHITAVEMTQAQRKEPAMYESNDLDPERPFDTPDDRPDSEIEASPTPDAIETPAEADRPTSPDYSPTSQPEVDSETGEILEATASPAIPDDRALVAIDSAPITWKTLEALSRTEFVPSALRGRPAAVLGAVLLGREYGLGPLEALRTIDVIDGSPSPNAELLGRLYRRAGHTIEVKRADSETVELKGTRGDTGDTYTATYSLDDAVRAGLVTLDDEGHPRARSRNGHPLPWESFTADLLWARCVTRLVRRLAPDALDYRTLEDAV
jgi:hypothetical protein